MGHKILIIEDERDLSDGVAIYLRHYGFEVCQSFDGQAAIKDFYSFSPDIILLDTILPDTRGHELCQQFKKESNVGIIFLTALSDKNNILDAFDSGSDDYITKPFDMDILLSRVRALLNRIKSQNGEVLSDQVQTISNLEFDMYKSDIIYNGHIAGLTPIEFRILYYLASKDEYCAKVEILKLIYGADASEMESRTISVHISNIRKKLRKICLDSLTINSKYNKGYRLEVKK